MLKPFQGTEQGGDPVSIDTAAFVEIGQANLVNAGLQGPAQARLSVNDVRTDPGLSPGGRYSSVFPLRDGTGRLLTTWTMCRLNDEEGRTLPCTPENLADATLVPAPPLYGVWLYDPRDLTQRPVLQPVEGIRYTEVISLAPRVPLPAVIIDAVAGVDYDPILAAENVGILNIRSVYDLDGADIAPGGMPRSSTRYRRRPTSVPPGSSASKRQSGFRTTRSVTSAVRHSGPPAASACARSSVTRQSSRTDPCRSRSPQECRSASACWM